ncbi:uncharacterized protein N7477_000829 [Penicillium maclennaniae]|uniref:uncharacterized protein n=1 Tax=Penicillium maclennaniae TaxID=1343394 RepID=UPI0025412DE3|nr:uncharacterized protein N7477_000829 [Penicillium maclennaniae]KAJ5684484.1 hypothetical protein N7477_000829 [Penicillium maclennaniae]
MAQIGLPRCRNLTAEAIFGHARKRQVQAEIVQVLVDVRGYTLDLVTNSMELVALLENHENRLRHIQELLEGGWICFRGGAMVDSG